MKYENTQQSNTKSFVIIPGPGPWGPPPPGPWGPWGPWGPPPGSWGRPGWGRPGWGGGPWGGRRK